MSSKTTDAEKSIVEQLDFSTKTSKHVTWEEWEFTVVGPHQVEVTNASYGYLKDEHSYTVGVEVRGGRVLPAECECPADLHHEQDCKHKVALAAIGGPTVLNAVTEYETPATTDAPKTETVADKLRADGGDVSAEASPTEEQCDCQHLSDFPCWSCYRSGKADLPW